MRISSTAFVEGRRILHTIGMIQAASAWHAANEARGKTIGVSISWTS